MSAETLCRAAALMRTDDDDRWHAVADLLAEIADDSEVTGEPDLAEDTEHPALLLARIYLGEQA